jgi:hypothetical protein
MGGRKVRPVEGVPELATLTVAKAITSGISSSAIAPGKEILASDNSLEATIYS